MTNRVVVIGGGHAGVEAACAAARLGVPTLLITLKKSGIGQMSCNPAIGGVGKGHLVKEVDALGGIMGRVIDATGIQFRTLNASKGPAVRASRAQADRDWYRQEVQRIVNHYPNLSVAEGEVSGIGVVQNRITGVSLADGSFISAGSVVVTTGTFLRGLMHTGSSKTPGGRVGELPAFGLSGSLKSLGLPLGRLKTGTPPRLRRSSIRVQELDSQPGETPVRPFSMMTNFIKRPQICCWLTETNARVHEVIKESRELSPMFNGQIESRGPRYCPSLEDKVFRFADRDRHTIFLEPEGFDSDVVYPNGISTSLPVSVQEKFVRLIRGLEDVEILQPGYAVEYDFVSPTVLSHALEVRDLKGLFLAGQINGTSGYEEAAAQGLIAGVNAALNELGREPFMLTRGEAYIGVLIDDLVTSGVDEPYRMFTSRAEYRLVLREDNAASRLCTRGIEIGLLPEEQIIRYRSRQERLARGRRWLQETKARPTSEVNDWLSVNQSAALKDGVSLESLLRRPELNLRMLIDRFGEAEPNLCADEIECLEVEAKFAGYIAAQDAEIARLKKLEDEKIPEDFPYDSIHSLRTEAREKLKAKRPASMGEALRIPGITPSAISLLAIHLKRHRAAASM